MESSVHLEKMVDRKVIVLGCWTLSDSVQGEPLHSVGRFVRSDLGTLCGCLVGLECFRGTLLL